MLTCQLHAQNVGIGTNAPQALLHIQGNADTSQLVIDANATQSNLRPLIRLRNAAGIDLLHIHSDDTSNTFIGRGAGRLNTPTGNYFGRFNSFIGAGAGYSNTTGQSNTANGFQPLYFNNIGYFNTANGFQALYYNTMGNYNTANGDVALYYNTTGNYNTAMGTYALLHNVAGNNATAIGNQAMEFANNTTTAFENTNVAVGYSALRGSTSNFNTGIDNTAFGYQTLYSNSTGNFNTASGRDALFSNSTGSYNNAYGMNALRNNSTGSYNAAYGMNALYNNVAGSNATAVGTSAMYYSSNTTTPFINYNVAVGFEALRGSTNAAINTGNYNSVVGFQALLNNSNGTDNTGIGRQTLFYNATGNDNTALGGFAGFGASGVNFTSCTFVGSFSSPTVARTNVTMLGADITNAECTINNQVLLGNTAVIQIKAQVTGITAYSDARFKRNIKEDVKGLDFIMKLKPVTYNEDPEILHRIWGTPDSLLKKIDHSEIKRQRFIGFLAQDVENAAKESGFDFPGIDVPKNEKEVYSLRYTDFVMPMIKGMQEQQQQIIELRKENDELKTRLDKMEKLMMNK